MLPGVTCIPHSAPFTRHYQAHTHPSALRASDLARLAHHRTPRSSPCRCNTSRSRRRGHGIQAMAPQQQQQQEAASKLGAAIGWKGVHHVGLLVQDLDKSRQFYEGILGMELNPERPDDRLPYGGAWFWLGPEMIHLMVLPNPDPMEGRPEHGGQDRHVAVGVESVDALQGRLEDFSIPFTRSKSGRKAIFFRDPDQNVLECVELEDWR